MERGQRHVIHQPLVEKAAKRCRMSGGQVGVFVEMKGRDAPPIDGTVVAQSLQKFILRRGSCQHYAGAAVPRDGRAKNGRGFGSSGRAGLAAGGIDRDSVEHYVVRARALAFVGLKPDNTAECSAPRGAGIRPGDSPAVSRAW